MFFGIYLIHGLFLGAFTSVQIEGYRRHAVFSYKLELITSYLVIIFLNSLKLYSYFINLSSAYIFIKQLENMLDHMFMLHEPLTSLIETFRVMDHKRV